MRSRVTPGMSCTTAARRPRMRLTSVDLPTLGRPTMATTGSGPLWSRSCPLPRPRRPCGQLDDAVDDGLRSRSVLSTTTASAAGRSGLSARLLSYSSRRRRSAARAAISAGSVTPELPGPALGADLGRRGQVDLERRVGQDDGADVAALDDDGVGRGDQLALLGDQLPADGRDGGHRRDRAGDLGAADALGDVDAVHLHELRAGRRCRPRCAPRRRRGPPPRRRRGRPRRRGRRRWRRGTSRRCRGRPHRAGRPRRGRRWTCRCPTGRRG